jgi:hypothetical protein
VPAEPAALPLAGRTRQSAQEATDTTPTALSRRSLPTVSRWRRAPAGNELRALAPTAYAGQWLDDHGRLHVAYTGDAEAHAAEARAHLGLSGRAEIVRHRYSYSELEALAEEVWDSGWWQAHGATLWATGIIESDNVVEISLEPLTAAASDAARARFGDAVRLVEGRVEPA